MVKIVKVKISDVKNLVSIQKASFASGLERPWSEKDFKTSLEMKGMKAYLLVIGGTKVAFILYRQIVDEAEIILFGVDPAYQRQGYATELLQHAFEAMKKSGVIKISLEVRDDNYAAMHFYEIAGFQEVGVRRDYYHLTDGQTKDAKLYTQSIQ